MSWNHIEQEKEDFNLLKNTAVVYGMAMKRVVFYY